VKLTVTLLILFALMITGVSAAPIETDLCIYGGTSAGVIAAVQALSYNGLRTKLLRDQQVLAVPCAQ
jgi:hypothetical protein